MHDQVDHSSRPLFHVQVNHDDPSMMMHETVHFHSAAASISLLVVEPIGGALSSTPNSSFCLYPYFRTRALHFFNRCASRRTNLILTISHESRVTTHRPRRADANTTMAADSPPTSPLSPPPSWFNDEDVECPLSEEPLTASSAPFAPSSSLSPPPSWFDDEAEECPLSEGPRAASPASLTPSSPLSPPPSRFRDEDDECPDVVWLATESRPDGGEIECLPVEGSRQDCSLPLSSSPSSSVPAMKNKGKPKGQKRSSKSLDDSYDGSAKRLRSRAHRVSDVDETAYTVPDVELGTPTSSDRVSETSDVSNITYQGEDSVFTEPVIEPGTPLSPLDSDVSNITVQGDDSVSTEPGVEPGLPILSSGIPDNDFLPNIALPRVYAAFTEAPEATFPADELATFSLSNILPREEEDLTFPKATDEHGTLSPQPPEWESTSVYNIIDQGEDAVSTKANEHGTLLSAPTKIVTLNVSNIASQVNDLLSKKTKKHRTALSTPAKLQTSKISDFTSQGEEVSFTEANELEMFPSPPLEPKVMDRLVQTPLSPAGELEAIEDSVSTEATEHGTPILRSREPGLVEDSVSTEADEIATLRLLLGKLRIVDHSVTDANEPGTPLLQPGEPKLLTKPEYKPEVWATLRGGLCEGLSYFRAYKGSLHSRDRTAIGFLIDKEASARDVFGSQVIISSVGGGRVLDAETNRRVRCEDAPDDAANIKAIRLAYECRALIAVVAGEDHPLYPCKPPHPYAVLDWFHITDLWAEMHVTREGHKPVRVWRMRFEKADLSKPSWWTPPTGEEPSSTAAYSYQTSTQRCKKCGVESKEIFKAGLWTCLNHTCASFFKFPPRRRVQVNKLEYTDAFLNERNPFVGPLPPLRPELPRFDGLHGTEKLLRHGFVCPQCGNCNRRVFWNRFSCENCPYKLESVMLPYPWEDLAKEEMVFEQLIARRRKKKPVKIVLVRRQLVEAETQPESSDEEGDSDMEDDSPHPYADDEGVIGSDAPRDGPLTQSEYTTGNMNNTQDTGTGAAARKGKGDEPFSTILNRDSITITQTLYFGSYKVRQYFLPDPEGNIIGSFALFISNPDINAAPNGPNELFRQLELSDIGLKRNAAALPGNKLEGLCRHFQQNFGAKYKFGVSVQSKGFDQAPDAILQVLQRLVWAAKKAVEATTIRLAEYDLGPDGPPPTSNAFNELLALGYMEDDRINYHDDGESELGPTVAALSLGSPSTMRFRPKLRAWSGLSNSLPKKVNGKAFLDVLEVPMKHGDMMVMHGAAIHRFYEHAVEPMGRRRFALTCRYIDPDKMTDQADRDDAAIKGAIPEHAKKFVYNGEI